MGRRLDLRGQGHLRPEEVRRDPAGGDARRRRVEVRQDDDDDDRDRPTTTCAPAATTPRSARRTSSSTGSTGRCRSRRSRGSAARRSTRPTTRSSRSRACRPTTTGWSRSGATPSIGINIPLCIMPLWDVELAATEIKRNAERGVRAVCFTELPTRLDLPSIHTGYWDPMFDGVQRHRHHRVHARRLVVDRPGLVAGRARGRRRAWSRSTTRWRRSATTSSAGRWHSSRS